jgi:hypothetical protein
MKQLILASCLAMTVLGSVVAANTEAEAVVCARGFARAGCVGPNGAIGVRGAVVAPRRVVVAPRRVVVAPRGIVAPRRVVRMRRF